MPSKYPPTTKTARATHCRQCGRPKTPTRLLSRRALCPDCGNANTTKAAAELMAQDGPAYDQWVASTLEHARRLEALR